MIFLLLRSSTAVENNVAGRIRHRTVRERKRCFIIFSLFSLRRVKSFVKFSVVWGKKIMLNWLPICFICQFSNPFNINSILSSGKVSENLSAFLFLHFIFSLARGSALCVWWTFSSPPPSTFHPRLSFVLLAILLRSQKREKPCRKSYCTFVCGCCENGKHHNEAWMRLWWKLMRMVEWDKDFDCKWKKCFVFSCFEWESFSYSHCLPGSMKFLSERNTTAKTKKIFSLPWKCAFPRAIKISYKLFFEEGVENLLTLR